MKKGRLDKEKIKKVIKNCVIFHNIINMKEFIWKNEKYIPNGKIEEINFQEVIDAESRLERFAPYINKVFCETNESNGIIESRLININKMKVFMENYYNEIVIGDIYCKCDNELPISGSIKARGGIYEVLKYAEYLAIKDNLINVQDDYSKLDSEEFKKFYSGYNIIVASTGNLGLSIGIISSKLGFKVDVHMSYDAKGWKKELLKGLGVNVIEHEGDYSKAIEIARKQANLSKNSYFIDDENSKDLFLGYAVAALRLEKQLKYKNIIIDERHPLLVYLPCGVGGAPGGITFGLKSVFGENVHCFLVEPTHAPAMILGLMTGQHENISVKKYGIDGKTDADGLAVGKPSGFVGKLLEKSIAGGYTLEDKELYKLLAIANNEEHLQLEPSAAASFIGPLKLSKENYIKKDIVPTHIVWATGGAMVPQDIWKKYYEKGLDLLKKDEII
ncbi:MULTISPECIES: D-serine ammonia-lyase [Clostridium]|uniref:Probable D-serine dehydratase n=1 Tax=Clostridium senegalense TaxID=1465809 RepID=A0A6M0H6M0_9CLOT|nr:MULTISPECIES: D-serine ammonia-lyase [Clostridium]NEU05988.1 D-serine ammonia-lyase [Clostridium senegalense]